MDTIDQLIKDGNALFSRITLNGEPDWQGEGANIPDDAYQEEDGGGSTVVAADASEVARLEELMRQAESAIDADGLVNEDAIASMLAAAWVSGAKEP